MRSDGDFGSIRPGDVLVCPITTPAWSLNFSRTGAPVTDAGGALSHAAIVAREHGLPAVVATGRATGELRDGQIGTVDGAAGTVAPVEEPATASLRRPGRPMIEDRPGQDPQREDPPGDLRRTVILDDVAVVRAGVDLRQGRRPLADHLGLPRRHRRMPRRPACSRTAF